MKQILFPLAFVTFFSGCKKTIKEELLQKNDYTSPSNVTANIQPVPAYRWVSMTVPAMTGYPNNAANVVNQVITVNGDTYCLMGNPVVNSYKYNSSNRQWEFFSDPNDIFRRIKEGNDYLFSYDTKMYFGFEWFEFSYLKNFGCVDVVTGVVTNLAIFPGRGVRGAAYFTVGGKGYVAGGNAFGEAPANQLYEYDFTTNQWTNKGNNPLGARSGATATVVDNKVYMGLGSDAQFLKKNDWKVYSPSTGFSGNLSSFPGAARSGAKGFVLNNIPYVGFGQVGSNAANNDLWSYNPSSGTWKKQADLPNNTTIQQAATFSIGNTGYLVKGGLNQFWRFTNSTF